MAPSPVQEDFYKVLCVEPNASLDLIVISYRNLALKLHPDRNARHDATAAFQLLGRAYETLKDECARRAYDLVYPTIARNPSTFNAPASGGSSASNVPSEAISDAAQIAALQKSKQERYTRWWTNQNASNSSISQLRREIERIERAVEDLNSIAAAEAAEEAQKNSWGTWLLSPFYKKVEDNEEEKARKDRGRQERMIEKNLKERRLGSKKADLDKAETLLRQAQEAKDAADRNDDYKIRVIQYRINTRERLEREERLRKEQERIAKLYQQQWEEQEKREREEMEALRKRRQEEVEAMERRREEENRKRQENFDNLYNSWGYGSSSAYNDSSTYPNSTATCRHDGWWPKIQGRQTCPECSDSWTYLLECPGCQTKACPKCQSMMRPRKPRGSAARASRSYPFKTRDPSPDYWYD